MLLQSFFLLSLQAENSTTVLDCEMSRWIWISWSEESGVQSISVGQGADIGGNVVLHWSNTNSDRHPVYSLGFDSVDVEVMWEFTKVPGELQSNII